MTTEHQQRKLAVILHADVAGSTVLVRRDETLAHQRITGTFTQLSADVERYGGSVHEVRGDALVAEFARASDAVSAALAFQRSHTRELETLDDDIVPVVRIGISLGEVVFADRTVTGAGVVLAQRVEQLAEPGGVCITAAIHEALPDRLPFEQQSLGDQAIKGFDEPVRVYAVQLRGEAEPPTPTPTRQHRRSVAWISAAALALVVATAVVLWQQPWKPEFDPASVADMAYPLPERPSVAVLPLDNISGDPAQDPLADSLTDEIITTLSRIPDLFVIARHSTNTYKGRTVSVKQVAQEQGVRYVLEGSTQRSGDRVRVNARLIDALEGNHVWAERYDRSFSDLFDLHDDITHNVAIALQVHLTIGEEARSRRRGTRNPEAFLLAHKAGWHYRRFNKEDTAKAYDLVQRARAIDPEALFPLQMEGWVHYQQSRFGWSESREESLQQAEVIAARCLAIDENDPDTHLLLASLARAHRDLDLAERHVARAIELNPNHPGAVGVMALVLNYSGRPQEAISFSRKAMRLSPVNPPWMPANLGLSFMMVGRYEEAIAAYQEVLARGAMTVFAHERLVAIHALKGDLERARIHAALLLEAKPDFTIEGWSKVLFYTNAADLDRELGALRKAGLPERPPGTSTEKPSIAVLPFANMSDDPEQEYFVDGMADDLITDLSNISGLFVIARNSAFAYKGKSVGVQQVASELGVNYVLEGSVRRAGNQVRINAQLVDASSGGPLWAERFDGTLDNVFAVQDQVTKRIVEALSVQLTSAELAVSRDRQQVSPSAYDAYLRGWEHLQRRTPEQFIKARAFLEQAIAMEPEFNRALASLAALYWEVDRRQWYVALKIGSSAEAKRATDEYLERALVSPTPLALVISSDRLMRTGAYDRALSTARQAMAMAPSSAEATIQTGEILVYTGHPDEALEHVARAERLDPLNQAYYAYIRGMAYFSRARYRDAVNSLDRALALNPEFRRPAALLAAAHGHLGQSEDALAARRAFAQEARQDGWGGSGTEDEVIDDVRGITTTLLLFPFRAETDQARLAEGLQLAGMPERDTSFAWW